MRQGSAVRTSRPGGGPREIPVLDGVRALAALGVLFYHAYGIWTSNKVVFGLNITPAWYFTQTGVHLFFVLSGCLLFLPYVRALLDARPLPAVRRFYWRRALRILPAYWGCLALLVLFQWRQFASPVGAADIATHIVLLHDDVSPFNRAIEGPFWTLAVEAQFYVLLPLLAWAIARFAAGSRSLVRVLLGTLGILAGALLVRELDAFAESNVTHLSGFAATADSVFVHVTMGMQGKFIEVFAIGMLCAVLYVAVTERGKLSPRVTRWLGLAAFGTALVGWIVLVPMVHSYHLEAPSLQYASEPGNWRSFFSPLMIGLSYGALVLAALWSAGPLHAFFQWRPLRSIGLMSYSLYLWHAAFLFGIVPFAGNLPIAWRVVAAFVGAYASYRLLELPFMRRRERARHIGEPAPRTVPAPSLPQAEHVHQAEEGIVVE